MRRFRALIEERANENREMTAGSRGIHAIQANYKKKMVLFITLLGKGLIQEI